MAIRIFRHYWQLPLAVLAIAEAVTFFAAMQLAAVVRTPILDPAAGSTFSQMLPRALLFTAVMFIAMTAMGLYNARQRSRLLGLLTRVAASVVGATMLIAIVFYLVPQLHIGRGTLSIAALFAFVGASVIRVLFDRLANEDVFKRRVLVYGNGKRAHSIARLRRRSDRRGFVVVGYVPAEGDQALGAAHNPERILEGKDLLTLCREHDVDEIVVAMDDRRRQFPMDQLLECRLEGVEIIELVSFLERETGKVRLDVLNPSWMIFSEGFRQGRIHSTLERTFDILASLILLVVALPVMLLTALAIKLT
ncbi:MAG: UDP-phosphate galactose phosphotransferase, partial [Proteobacteria bacterium]